MSQSVEQTPISVIGSAGGSALWKYTVDTFADLASIPNPIEGDIARVRFSQGTAWLPGTLGGTYYPSGFYEYRSGVWEIDDTLEQIADQLNDILNDAVFSVNAGQWITVDNTDPSNPIVSLTENRGSLFFTFPLSGVIDNQINVLGTFVVVANGLIIDYPINFPVSNQHVAINVNSITTGGTITITGTSINESTSVPVTGDTEVLTVDTSTGQFYQTTKKWLEVTNVDISSGGITGLNYGISNVGYHDSGNGDFKILGYRADFYSQSGGDTSDISLVLVKVQDDGAGKMSLVFIEDYGIDSGGAGNQVIDNIRTGGDDRSYNPVVSNIWLNNTIFTLKQGDFDTYFTADENVFESSTKDEGLIVRFEGAPAGGITGVDFVTLRIDVEFIES